MRVLFPSSVRWQLSERINDNELSVTKPTTSRKPLYRSTESGPSGGARADFQADNPGALSDEMSASSPKSRVLAPLLGIAGSFRLGVRLSVAMPLSTALRLVLVARASMINITLPLITGRFRSDSPSESHSTGGNGCACGAPDTGGGAQVRCPGGTGYRW